MYILGNLSINDTYFMLKPYREESESSHESPPIAQSEPSTITRQDSSVEASLEPQTLKGEEIQPSKFTSKFEDDHSRYLLDTLNSFVSQTVEDPHSVQIIHTKNLSTEPPPRPTVPPFPPDPPNETFVIMESMEKKWST
jgi:hypothetical protein